MQGISDKPSLLSANYDITAVRAFLDVSLFHCSIYTIKCLSLGIFVRKDTKNY